MTLANPSYNMTAQFAHAGMAYSITLSVLLLFGMRSLYWYLPASVGLAAFKEFYYDQKYETAEVRGSNTEDFLFYVLGIITATVFWMFFVKGLL
jgi:hypothetical protein